MRTEDGYIIYKCLNGEPEAFGLLVEKYKVGVYAFVLAKLHDFHDAQDVAQDVFIKAYYNLHKLKRWDSFAAWLYRIASNSCKNRLKVESRRPDSEFAEDHDQETLDKPSIESYRDDTLCESVREALDSLPETYQQVLTMRYIGGMNSVEIANALGISPTNVRYRLSKAREQLKEEVLPMMSASYEQNKLHASFTIRIVEAVKRIRVHPLSTAKGLPWGLSLAAGIIITFLSIGSHPNPLNVINTLAGHPLPSESRVLKAGEIPVDVLRISEMTVISSDIGKGKGVEPEQFNVQNSFFMASQGQGDTWTKRADMPTPRHGISACAVNGKIYVFGGAKDMGNGASLSTVEEYDPATNEWTKKADMPAPRARLSTCAVNGKIYAIGGWGGWAAGAMDEYDPATDKWTRKTPMIAPSERLAVSAVGEKIYTFGGWSGAEWKAIATTSEYDTVTDTWTKKADLPEQSEYYSASTVNGKIYIIGWFHNVLEYDPISDKYTQKAAIPSKREGNPNFWHDGVGCWHLLLHSASVIRDKIYVIGGSQPNGNHVAVYDPIADKWEEKADMPTARCWLATGEVNGKIYAIGGTIPDVNTAQPGTGQPFSTVEEYDTGFASINVGIKEKLPTRWGGLKTTTKEDKK